MTDDKLSKQEALNKINLETAKINWHELQSYFAAGQIVFVAAELDLVAVAYAVNSDDSPAIEAWTQKGQLYKVKDEQAKSWYQTNKSLWAVVIKPWILVQETKD